MSATVSPQPHKQGLRSKVKTVDKNTRSVSIPLKQIELPVATLPETPPPTAADECALPTSRRGCSDQPPGRPVWPEAFLVRLLK